MPLATNPAHGVTTATTQYQKAAMYGSHAGYGVGEYSYHKHSLRLNFAFSNHFKTAPDLVVTDNCQCRYLLKHA